MYRLDREDFIRAPLIALWSLLGFQAGFINAFGFLACGRYVSHVTGFGTQIGVAIAAKDFWFAIELLGFPLSFIAGSFVSGLLTIARIECGKRPYYDRVTASFPVLIGLLLVLGRGHLFGPFGEQLVQTRDFILLFLLSFVCGMQNGCFATLTKGQVRTTHLTGISTDLGTDLARLLFGKLKPRENLVTRRVNVLRLATFGYFASGSIASVWCSSHWGYSALAIPCATSLIAYVAVRRVSQRIDAEIGAGAQVAPAV